VPTPAELAAGKALLELCVLEACNNGSGEDVEDSTCELASFENMRTEFLKTHCHDLQDAGIGHLQPAPIASHVQNRFLEKCNLYGAKTLVLGYHGTPECNHASIFNEGLLVPGQGNSVRIANGNAHGRGIYIAEKGAEYLSMSFLRGSSKLLVCGVVDNTIVEQAGTEEGQDIKTNKNSRFSFKGGVLAHRCRRQPKRSQQGQKAVRTYLGCQPLHSETKEVRHVGNAMVVRDEKHVAPLFVAETRRNVSHGLGPALGQQIVPMPELERNSNRDGQPDSVGCRQCLDPRTLELCWLPPTEHRCSHAIKMKRGFEKRLREAERRQMRAEKLSY